MGELYHSHAPLDINSSGSEENLISHSPEEIKLEPISFDENDACPVPRPGMVFSSEAEARFYYTKYAHQMGFGIMTRTSKKGHDGKVKYLILVCSEITRSDALRKQYCAARINLTLRKDGTYRINAATLGHSHELGSHHLLSSDIEMRGKRTLDQEVIDMDCNVSVASDDGSVCCYNVIEDVIIEDKPKESVVEHFEPHGQRLELLCNQFNSIAAVAAEFEDTSSFVKDNLCNLKEKLETWTTLLRKSSQVDVEKSVIVAAIVNIVAAIWHSRNKAGFDNKLVQHSRAIDMVIANVNLA
ncbi:hypothetical protein glysoja_012668 [Glycine soja]|nr:hypothetical protein glysoja_012668 [Glycine soja]